MAVTATRSLEEFQSSHTDIKYTKMVNGRHCHMFSDGISEVEIQILSTLKWQMGVTAICFLVEFRK